MSRTERLGSRTMWRAAATALAVVTGVGAARAQESLPRAVPAGVDLPPFVEAAMRRGTRTDVGEPGPGYWQNWTSYDLDARLDPATARLVGSATIRYENRSPYGISFLLLHLHQNLHAEGAARNEPQEVTGGVKLTHVSVDADTLAPTDSGTGYSVAGTRLRVQPRELVQSGDTVTLRISWESTLPQNGAGRMGHSDKEMYFVAYWFPKVGVFDDLRGWDVEPYLGGAEFYDGFGDYRAALTVPVGWTVMATGELQNSQEVYSPQTLGRLARAASSDHVVEVAGSDDLREGRVTAGGQAGSLTYRFRADSVRDFTWTTSNVQRWDASSAVVADRDGDGAEDRVLIHAFWREERAPLWAEQWRYAKQSIEFHSRHTGLAYPWPHMTSVEGADIIGGGMEFPMLTLIGPYVDRAPQDLFNVTSHEIGHMWIPMIVGTNEKRYAWMDEGATTFLEDQSRMELWPGVDHHRVEGRSYLQVADAGLEQSMMRHGDWYEPGPGYGVASYAKPATLMVALRELVMEPDAWNQAYRSFIREWAYKHPTPWDFFNTFERAHGEDLDWFWTSFYWETWTLDHGVTNVVTRSGGATVIHVRDLGRALFPAILKIYTANDGILERRVEVEHWLAGNTRARVEIPASAGRVTRVELNPSGYAPDVDRSNDFWPRG